MNQASQPNPEANISDSSSNDRKDNPPRQITPYILLGGEPAVRQLVRQFYNYMDSLPEVQGIRRMHAADLSGAEEKLFMYLSGWLGGPQLFIEKYGHPMLRARHLNFSIGTDEASQWLTCMRQALTDVTPDEHLRSQLMLALTDLALHMRNKAD